MIDIPYASEINKNTQSHLDIFSLNIDLNIGRLPNSFLNGRSKKTLNKVSIKL